MIKYVSFFLVLVYGLLFPQTRIVINEFMASNKTNAKDPKYFKYSDWIEVYNAGSDQVNLKGYYLTDNLSNPSKWKFERNVLLSPGQFYIFWADDEDTLNHTSFGLSKDGEQLGLFYPDGSPADTFTYYFQRTDISYGRYPDGSNQWYHFYNPTVEKANDTLIYKELLSNPAFSIKSGFYYGQQTLVLQKNDPAITIRYTEDGSVPEESSKEYLTPILISKTTVIRAACYKEGSFPSNTVTNTYFIDENIKLPVVSISTNPANLTDPEIGIYVTGTNGITGYCSTSPQNFNQDWERPIHFELFERDKKLAFEIDAGMKIGGGCTRKYAQKPLGIYTRSTYGDSKIKYQIFPDKPIEEFNNIALRNSGQDWYRTLLRDGMMQTIVKHQMDIDWQAYKPAVLFLNGEYWGIHDIREKHNEHYLAANHNIDDDSIDIVSGYVNSKDQIDAKAGSSVHFVNMIKYMQSHDLTQDQYYNYIATQMDIDQYINYLIIEIFFGNADWPGGNIKFWRPQRADGKWRWIIFDLDMAFGAHGNSQYNTNNLYLASSENNDYYANPKAATFQFRSLLLNKRFRDTFIQRFAYHLNTTFRKERILFYIDSLKNEIAPEINRHTQKWVKSCSYDKGSWEQNFQILYEYAENRHAHIRNHFLSKFNISGSAKLTIMNNHPGGKVLFDNIELKNDTLSGLFFKDIPIQIIAIPEPGYSFKGWNGSLVSDSDTLSVTLTGTSVLFAQFEKTSTEVKEDKAVFTFALEQNYPNPFNPVTIINYQLSQSGTTTLKIYDLLGEEVALLVNETKNAGSHSIEYNASGLPSGVYFYHLQSGSYSSTKKMIILK